jgi:hypothetical protein
MPSTRRGGEQVAFITDEMAAGMARMMAERAAVDPEFAEDCKSLLESKDYFTHPWGMSKPEKCEVCGTLVTVVPEVSVHSGDKPQFALWEPGAWRKHTPVAAITGARRERDLYLRAVRRHVPQGPQR